MTTDICIITTTLHDSDTIENIINTLLEKKLAACIQTYPIYSHYKWKGKIEHSKETLLQIKTKINLFEKIKQEIETLHEYEVPEIIVTPILKGNNSYISWVNSETT